MKESTRFLALALSALVFISVACATNIVAADGTTIIGTVYGEAWDENDDVTAATIVTATGKEYVIVDNAVGKELFRLDNKVVKASGVIGEPIKGDKTFTVTNYEVMPE